MAYFVYIIQSQIDDSLYIGQTSSIQERLLRHNQGRSRFTKLKRPWKLLYSEEFESRSQAIKREADELSQWCLSGFGICMRYRWHHKALLKQTAN
jgi:putative endonuclease